MGLFTPKDRYDPYRRLPESELLTHIHTGDQLAEAYLWVTFHPIVSTHMRGHLRNKPQQLGDPGDYAHDAILLLLDKARRVGAAVFKHDHSTISGWLKQTALYFMQASDRKDRANNRDNGWGKDETTGSILDTIKDEGADSFADMPVKDRDQIIRNVLASLPERLQMLIRLRFMDGFSWKETADLMVHLFPDNDPPFELAYLQKTYWDRVHKRPFYKLLGNALI